MAATGTAALEKVVRKVLDEEFGDDSEATGQVPGKPARTQMAQGRGTQRREDLPVNGMRAWS